ncbi:hypothetical protein JAB8_43960 [Janthinobacterium sp. HH106]|uniref:hypothetical protein n=1 Tax=Janthinobacterium sp. HH106 TaxID=1537278 RepID=UPI000892E2CA|nr:hypothetical protein [Janthinobacterium sp. HH106]OEZ83753.1 hypothetical protein JAB8_43960 [Janthinobacterium sp. HH106]
MSPKFWEYYLAIEEDLLNCSRYVEFSEQNYSTYSNEFAKIIVLSSAEIDNILRELCELMAPGSNAGNINKYHSIITNKYPNIINSYVKIRMADINLQPWNEWVDDKSPEWWRYGYNKIKHDRTNYFHQANLKNALHSVGALFLIILHYHDFLSEKSLAVDFNRSAKLFTPETPEQGKSGMFMSYGIR